MGDTGIKHLLYLQELGQLDGHEELRTADTNPHRHTATNIKERQSKGEGVHHTTTMHNRSERPYQAGMKYVLPRDEGELKRLNEQHKLALATVYEGRLVYDRDVVLNPGSRVLDTGSGTGIWLMDLSKEVPSSVDLFGVDVSAENFPTSHPSNIQFHIASTTDLLKDWSGQVDLVHQRYLVAALLAEEWPKTISENFRVLKPGGHIQLIDLHMTDVVNAGPAFSRAAKLFDDVLHKRDLLPDCAKQLSRMLEEAGFIDIVTLDKRIPAGRSEGEMATLGEFAVLGAFRRMIPVFLSEGLVSSEDELMELIEDVEREWAMQYTLISVYLIHAKKPL